MNHRRHFFFLLKVLGAVGLAVFLGILGVIVYVDPLQALHNQKSDPVYLYSQQRYRTAGLIRRHFLDQQDTQTILMGTSMLENALASDVERLTPLGKTLNVSFGACIYGELRHLYQQVLRSPSLKNIVVEFMPKAYLGESPETWADTPFPAGLYAANPLRRLPDMYLADTFRMAMDILRGKPASAITDANTASAWMPSACNERLFSTFAATYATQMQTQEPFARVEGLSVAMRSYLDNLRRTPEHVQVYVLVSPFFVGYNLPLDLYEQSLRALVDLQREKPNLHILAFDDVAAITCNAANYKDLLHHGMGVTRYILRSLAAGRHQLNAHTLEGYLERVRQLKAAMPIYVDTENTIAFEGPMNEALFANPHATGPRPVLP